MIKTIKKTFDFTPDDIFHIIRDHLIKAGQIVKTDDNGLSYAFSGELEYDDDEDDAIFSVTLIEEEE